MDRVERFEVGSWLAVAESLAVLAACIALTLLLTWPFVALEHRMECSLDESASHSAERLLPRLEGLQEVERATIRRQSSGEMIEVVGFGDAASFTAAVGESLRRFGISAEACTQRSGRLDAGAVLQRSARAAFTIQALVFLCVGGAMARLRLGRANGRWNPRRRLAVALGLAGGVAAFAVSFVVSWLLHVVGWTVQEQAWVGELLANRGEALRLAPWIIFLVPVAEEVFFRRYLFRWLTERAGTFPAFAISSLLFAVVHFNPSGLAVYVAIGLCFAGLYWHTRSLLAPVLGHVTHNALVLSTLVTLPGA